MNNYRFLEMRVDKFGVKKMTQDELSSIINIDRNRIQQLETSFRVIPKEEELRAYCKYFNTTSDYLLGIRDTKPVDENIAMISKTTGLSGDSIEILKRYKDLYRDILNYFIESNALWKLIKVVAIDAHLGSFTDKSENDDNLSYGEYITLRSIENIIKELFRNEVLYGKIKNYTHERICAQYGNDDMGLLELPEVPE